MNSKFTAADCATIGRKSSISKSLATPRSGQYNRAGALVEEMGIVGPRALYMISILTPTTQTITELQAAVSALTEEDKRRQANIAKKPDKASNHGTHHSGAVRSLFKTRKSG